MSDVDFGSFFVQLVTAGNDTTKTMLSTLDSAIRGGTMIVPASVEDRSRAVSAPPGGSQSPHRSQEAR